MSGFELSKAKAIRRSRTQVPTPQSPRSGRFDFPDPATSRRVISSRLKKALSITQGSGVVAEDDLLTSLLSVGTQVEEGDFNPMDAIAVTSTARNMLMGAEGAVGDTIDQLLSQAGVANISTEGVSQLQNVTERIITSGSLNEGLQIIADEVKERAGTAAGEGQIQPGAGIQNIMTSENILGTIAGFVGQEEMDIMGPELAGDVGQKLAQKLLETGIRITKPITDVFDKNKDGVITGSEFKDTSTSTDDLEELMRINPTIAKLVTDKSFVSRIIKRRDIPSIYGDNLGKRFNQVSLVEQGVAADHESANQFNVGFEGSK